MQLQQTGGFLDTKRRSPIGMGLIIAGHVVVLGTIILNPPEFIRDPVTHTVLTDYREDEPPPPNPEVIPPKTAEKVESVVDLPKSVIERTDVTSATFPTQPQILPPPLPPIPATPPQTVERQPVLVEALLDERYRNRFQPDYPPSLARQEIEGAVTVRVLIGTDGRVKAVEQVSSAEPAFFAATQRQALAQWRFRPATRDGVAVESWRTMTVRFRMA